MKSLIARLDRLESSVGIGNADISIFIDFPPGHLTGIRVGQTVVNRPPDEPEAGFIARMRIQNRRVGINAVLLIGERRD